VLRRYRGARVPAPLTQIRLAFFTDDCIHWLVHHCFHTHTSGQLVVGLLSSEGALRVRACHDILGSGGDSMGASQFDPAALWDLVEY
jgi:hypothetical protein